MDFKITEEKLLEVAEYYGLTAKKSDNPGFKIEGKEVDVDELFDMLFPSSQKEKATPINFDTGQIKAIKQKTKVQMDQMNEYRSFVDVGVA